MVSGIRPWTKPLLPEKDDRLFDGGEKMIKWTSKNEDNILEQASGGLLKEIPGEKEIELDEEAIDKGVSQRLTALVLKKFERILQEDVRK
mmetsp:Transcript_23227/g.39094  ORF Transcript_23227/g.39094 Transcript_23227/m.39094 type:complete len:90 (+) Transcript_23227:277-546(+)